MLNSRLKVARMRANKTQKEIADFLGISSSSYQNYELGKRNLNQSQIVKLANYYGVTIDYLTGRDLYEIKPIDDQATSKLAKTIDEVELLDLYRKLSPYLQETMLENARNWAHGVNAKRK